MLVHVSLFFASSLIFLVSGDLVLVTDRSCPDTFGKEKYHKVRMHACPLSKQIWFLEWACSLCSKYPRADIGLLWIGIASKHVLYI